MRTTTSRPEICELCNVDYKLIRIGVLVIDHRGTISGDLYTCPDGCGDRVVHVNDQYHDDLTHLDDMIEFYPQWVFDLRPTIKIFEPFDGLGMLNMERVQRELEASTFEPDMMRLRVAFAASERHAGVRFLYEPKPFITAVAYLKIKRFEEISA